MASCAFVNRNDFERRCRAGVFDSNRARAVKNCHEFTEHNIGPPSTDQRNVRQCIAKDVASNHGFQVRPGGDQVRREVVSSTPIGQDYAEQVPKHDDMWRVAVARFQLGTLVERECLCPLDGFDDGIDLARGNAAIGSEFVVLRRPAAGDVRQDIVTKQVLRGAVDPFGEAIAPPKDFPRDRQAATIEPADSFDFPPTLGGHIVDDCPANGCFELLAGPTGPLRSLEPVGDFFPCRQQVANVVECISRARRGADVAANRSASRPCSSADLGGRERAMRVTHRIVSPTSPAAS